MKKCMTLLLTMAVILSLCGCTPDVNDDEKISSSESYNSAVSDDDYDYDYDKGYGYTAPESGQSFSDYVKEQDPDLYDSMTDIYNSAVSDDYDYDKGYGYTAPKPGQTFSDYVKEQDPDLYNSLFS